MKEIIPYLTNLLIPFLALEKFSFLI
jgi:hypothetical protein